MVVEGCAVAPDRGMGWGLCKMRKKGALRMEPWRTSPWKGFAEDESGKEEGGKGTDSQQMFVECLFRGRSHRPWGHSCL